MMACASSVSRTKFTTLSLVIATGWLKSSVWAAPCKICSGSLRGQAVGLLAPGGRGQPAVWNASNWEEDRTPVPWGTTWAPIGHALAQYGPLDRAPQSSRHMTGEVRAPCGVHVTTSRVKHRLPYGCSRSSSRGESVEIKKTVIREEERTNRRPAVMEKRPPR
jgi:hypothetical protein